MAIAADRPRTRLPPPNRLRPTAGGIKIKREIKIATHLRLTLDWPKGRAHRMVFKP